MSTLAVAVGAGAIAASGLSTLQMMFCAEKDDRRHGEYQAIGWGILAALMWLVAK